MKMSIKFLALFISVLILNTYLTSCLELKNKAQKEANNNKNEEKSTEKSTIETKKPESYEKIWQELFHSQRGGACKSDKLKAKLKKKLADASQNNGQKAKKGKFAWVKEWGYGKTAYFLDFLDPVLLEDVLGEFKKIYKDMFAMSSKDTKKYKDPFDMKKLMGTDKKMMKKFAKNLKKINKNYEPKIYKVSVNAVQIHTAMPKWKWSIDVGLKDYAVTFLKKYDMNGDGRLNPRELILGALEHNKHLFGTGICTHCMEGVTDKIDAIFQYLDCDNDGKITSEDLWNNLPKIKRSSTKYDIFALAKNEGIRLDAINDFILKNNVITIGALNKIEFRNGIIYGIWDRQTDFFSIIDGDKKSLKHLRWSSGRTVDTKAFQTLKEIKMSRMKKKAKKTKKDKK